ncbi:GNAT family protein [Roseisolibacter sp. H3M3-2]|uniref:GNAT family N-acetyltransferase n=1 Tax=Roseisolibacter sp. H3M3-2 TaxID=3031323 RepID=UPI0023DB64A7|nr:GNAT family protein [Roseisolibacter sp. H3M3-2]MDF1505331.1 GNAT family protein [Roseisolibacter sp. H3M3-2]
MLPAILECRACVLRPWRADDLPALLRHADDRDVARNLRDRFPHPYTAADGEGWLAHVAGDPPREGAWAVDVGGEAVGGIALHRGDDVARLSAEIGYWLGRAHWGRGVMTEVVGRVTDAALAEPDLVRLHAPVFAWNAASMRVLERNGYVREGVMRRAGVKDGVVMDQVLYARTRESPHPYVAAP